jgi:hypothetical protein
VITDDMLHTVPRRRARGESMESIRPDLIIPTGKRKGKNPGLASIYRALAEHEKRQRYPEAVEQAHTDFAALQAGACPVDTRESRDMNEQNLPTWNDILHFTRASLTKGPRIAGRRPRSPQLRLAPGRHRALRPRSRSPHPRVRVDRPGQRTDRPGEERAR